ncbi:MAG: hypothetical protein IKW03_03420 [Clostridia bacterium]|nr:hypothetical protein [Clostridia bacterium]
MAQSQLAYNNNFTLFGSYDYGTSAPKLDPVYEPQKKPAKKQTTVKKQKQTQTVSKSAVKATQASFIMSVKIVAVLAVIFSFFSVAMFLNGMLDETATDITKIESEIKVARSENVRLESALEGMVAIDKVEDYAENNLGMVKLENYKITYFESDEGNHVVVSGGKSYSDKQPGSKITGLTEYIQ